jgi:hypothetical protein
LHFLTTKRSTVEVLKFYTLLLLHVDLGENNHETKRPEVLIVVKLSKIHSKINQNLQTNFILLYKDMRTRQY